MEIVVKRIAKKNTYTIGRLYLLADGDVKRKALSGRNAGDKRSFRNCFDMEKLSALYARPEYKGRLRVEAGSKPCVSLRIKAKGRVIDEARAFVREWGAEKAE